ncbi:uncharacterized protein K444DRAFT_621836 [Hyaloscypha bicolor E]|uniref:EthD domain-containing protein n=1 Tax=Hyaloscypha bicolor E TaxID=1095630 RepID=A0A2J6SI66_9HELO|nr:uncharacterized protein K444DRAFT_621836 [Hyaloscypha bicolor E]PMD50464.1 hypothetical protein K444DRAFT_621836 [Hyaloscypha bicolor E]
MPNNQALIKSKPGLTQQQFSDLWYAHAAIVTPMFLYSGVKYYAQVHGPLTTTSSPSTLDLSPWAGAAEKPPSDSSVEDPQWLTDYYREVVMVDEKRFLDRDAEVWFKRVEPGTVEGERKIIIDGGKLLIEIPESVTRVWKEYEKRGKEEK